LTENKKFVAWFNQLGGEDDALASGKGTNLAEMIPASTPEYKWGGKL